VRHRDDSSAPGAGSAVPSTTERSHTLHLIRENATQGTFPRSGAGTVVQKARDGLVMSDEIRTRSDGNQSSSQ
jgi:hypothetical protein